LYGFDVVSGFLIAENGGKTIQTAREHVTLEKTSPFDSLTPIRSGSAVKFFVYLSLFKSYRTRLFRFTCKIPSENFWEEIAPEKPSLSMRASKSMSLGQSAWFEAPYVLIGSVIWSVGGEKKKW
jgi:hypothetical protein